MTAEAVRAAELGRGYPQGGFGTEIRRGRGESSARYRGNRCLSKEAAAADRTEDRAQVRKLIRSEQHYYVPLRHGKNCSPRFGNSRGT